MQPVWLNSGSLNHPLGTDNLGRDLLSRIIAGARLSLLIGGVSDILASVIGTFLGLVAGYVKGWLGSLIMRITDLQMAVPGLLVIFEGEHPAMVGVRRSYRSSTSLASMSLAIFASRKPPRTRVASLWVVPGRGTATP